MSDAGVHFNKELDNELKQLTQKKFIEVYPNLDFLKTLVFIVQHPLLYTTSSIQ